MYGFYLDTACIVRIHRFLIVLISIPDTQQWDILINTGPDSLMTFSTLLICLQELFFQLPGPLHPRRGFQQAQAALSFYHLKFRSHTVLTVRTGVHCKQIQALFFVKNIQCYGSGFKIFEILLNFLELANRPICYKSYFLLHFVVS
jgi:hypothetical protein